MMRVADHVGRLCLTRVTPLVVSNGRGAGPRRNRRCLSERCTHPPGSVVTQGPAEAEAILAEVTIGSA